MRLVDWLRRWVAPAAAAQPPSSREAMSMGDDWKAELNYRYGQGGLFRVSAREAADALARDLREMPAISIAALVGHDVWCTDGREWPGTLPLLPRATAIIDYAHIRRVPAEAVICGDCGRGLLLADAWLAKGRIVCPTCVGTEALAIVPVAPAEPLRSQISRGSEGPRYREPMFPSSNRQMSQRLVALVDELERYRSEGNVALESEIRREIEFWVRGSSSFTEEEQTALIWGPFARARQVAFRYGIGR